MTDPTSIRFVEALRLACNTCENIDQRGREAVERAVQRSDPCDMLMVRSILAKFPESIRGDVVRWANLNMVTDISAIWDTLPGTLGKPRPN